MKYSKGNPYLYLVESYREGGKVRQRVLKYLGSSGSISDKHFLMVVEQSYKSSKKMGDVVEVPELTKRIQKKTGLSKEEVHKKLHDAYIEKKIDLQPGKGKDSIIAPDKATFQYMQPRSKLGTTDIKSHYDKINKETRAGNMVRIPDIYKKLKKQGVTKEEFRRELLELERKRVIDLQTASDTKVISPKDREGGFYLKDGEIYDYDERPGPTRRGYINYVVWRN